MIGAVVLLTATLIWASRKSGPRSAEVTGVVTVDGQPIEGLEVTFMPDPAKGGNGPGASGYTDARGRFRVGSAGSAPNGVSSGFHRVVISDPAASAPPRGVNAQEINDPNLIVKEEEASKVARPKLPGPGTKKRPLRIPQEYGDVSGTPLVDIELKAGSQELNFELGPHPH